MKDDDSSHVLASSFTDMMTSLAVIFILLFVAMLNNAHHQGEASRTNMAKRLEYALRDFMKTGGKDDIQVMNDPKDPLGILLIVPEGLLNFQKANYRIPILGTNFLSRFIPTLAKESCSSEFRDEVSSIVIEGHTDSDDTEENNLRLSQQRSLEVFLQIRRIISAADAVDQSCFVQFLSASGRGEAELIKKNNIEDKDSSRRVVFKIRVKSLEQKVIQTSPS